MLVSASDGAVMSALRSCGILPGANHRLLALQLTHSKDFNPDKRGLMNAVALHCRAMVAYVGPATKRPRKAPQASLMPGAFHLLTHPDQEVGRP